MQDNTLDEIKSRCNIVDVIGKVVPLKKAGANYKGICPFHNEKTPSFVVSESKQIFTCFGCGARGDVIEFVQRYYHLDFMEAVEKLAGEYGIEITHGGGASSQKKEKLYEINRMAAKFFFSHMTKQGSPGYLYMYNRGITADTIKKFGIGYAPDSWDSLYQFMMSKDVDPETLVKLGLLSKKENRYYDKFRNRVMFPIINTRGKIIGFGGRIIGDGNPKYLNSPESDIFLKKNNLYGINLTREYIAEEDTAILVEGYMDVVSLFQSGVRNVSASLGTALTENQARMLKRYTKNIILSYDADNAGRAAALRGIDILHEQGLKAKVLHVTDGKDPDEFVKKQGKTAFLELTKKAPGFADYKIDALMKRHDIKTSDGRIDFVRDAAAFLQKLSPAEQDIYIKKIASVSRISEGAIRYELEGKKNPEQKDARPKEEKHETAFVSSLEKNLIRMMLMDSTTYEEIRKEKEVFQSPEGMEIFDNIGKMMEESEEIQIQKLSDSLSEESLSVLNDIQENVMLGGNVKKILEETLNRYRLEKYKNRYEEITKIIEIADESENSDRIHELLMEQMEILKLMQEIRERRQA